MSWYQNILPEGIKKNVCAYLLQRYLGQFFEEKLTREQLNIDLYNGTGTVEKISLDVQVGFNKYAVILFNFIFLNVSTRVI